LNFDVFVSVNGGNFVLWQDATTVTAAYYNALPGSHYAFYSRARDRAGNYEDAPTVPDAQTTVRDLESATIFGVKFHDLNGNGIRDDGEPGLEGWTIFLDADGNGTWDQATEPSRTTAADGSYSFTVHSRRRVYGG
jgi:hypothetical protein